MLCDETEPLPNWSLWRLTRGALREAVMADSSLLNPFLDASPWGVVDVGGLRLPGVVVSIDGANRPEDWQIQKPTAKSGASTVWKGTGLAETITIVLALANADAFQAYYAVRDALRPKIGTKPPSHVIVSPIINFSGITRVSCRNVEAPAWVASGGYWTGKVVLVEYNPPKPANTGPAGHPAASTEVKNNPNADLEKVLKDLTDQIAKGGAN